MGTTANRKIIRILTVAQAGGWVSPDSSAFYVGSDYQAFADLRYVQSLASHFPDVQEVASDFLVNLDSQMHNSYCATVSHNRYLSQLPDQVLRVLSMMKVARVNRNTVFVVDTDTEAFLYARVMRNNGFSCPDGAFIKTLSGHVCSLRNGLFLCIRTLKEVSDIVRPQALSAKKFWFVSWLNGSDLSYEGLLKNNRYYGDMLVSCSAYGEVGIIGRHVSGVTASTNVSSIQDYRRFGDVIGALFRNLGLLAKLFGSYRVGTVDLTNLVRHSIITDMLSGRYIETLLDVLSFRRLAGELPGGACLIYPFENQPWEKALLASVLRKGKCIKTYGYQFFPFPSALMMDRFSRKQFKDRLIPDAILSSDMVTAHMFSAQGINTIPAGTQRYKSELASPMPKEGAFNRRVVLCSLFLDEKEAMELSMKSMLATKDIDCRLWINMHPMMPDNTKNKIHELASAYNHVTVKDESFSALISQVGLVLYNSSSVVYDAVLRGVPALYVASDLVSDMNRFIGHMKSFTDPVDGGVMLRALFSDELAYQNYAQQLHRAALANLQPVNNQIWEQL